MRHNLSLLKQTEQTSLCCRYAAAFSPPEDDDEDEGEDDDVRGGKSLPLPRPAS